MFLFLSLKERHILFLEYPYFSSSLTKIVIIIFYWI